jgi:hypothetical protein
VKKASWFTFFSLLAFSCLDEPECFQLKNDQIGITFRVMGTGAVDTASFKGIVVDNRVLITPPALITSAFVVGLNYFKDTTAIVFDRGSTQKHLTLHYLVQPQFISENCSPRYYLSELKAARHTFDSVRISNPVPASSAQTQNVDIYRCPSDVPLMGVNFRRLLIGTNGAVTSQNESLTLESVTADFSDTPLLSNTAAESVYVPVRLTPGESVHSTYVFAVDQNGKTERPLALKYTVTNEVRFRPCGAQNYVSALEVVSSGFDSVRIARTPQGALRNRLLDPPITNVEVFQCPLNNQIQVVFKTAQGTGVADRKVTLKGVRMDYRSDTLRFDPEVTSIVLPLNTNADFTQFYVDYENRTEARPLFRACNSPRFISELREQTDLPNVQILQPEVRYPAAINVQILD